MDIVLCKASRIFNCRFCIKEILELLQIADRLLGPGGCPWDREQTLLTLQKYLLEETHELIEAIDRDDSGQIVEEMGDVLFSLIFIGKLGEKANRFTFNDAVQCVCEKLIRRHPHIFAGVSVNGVDDIVQNWEAIKKKEKERKTIFEGIPPTLPILARAQKMIEKLQRHKSSLAPIGSGQKVSEEEVARRLWELLGQAQSSGVDAESALRRYCQQIKNTGE
ncbi:MAG: yabN [Parachlamydiales bacterium]|nr:yabN [Parachlamydiales bacterium]